MSLRTSHVFSLVLILLALVPTESRCDWDLSTSDTKLVIAVEGDREMITRIGHIENHFNWLAQPMAVPLMAKVGVGDREVETHWKFTGGVFDKTTGVLTLSFANENPKLVLRSIWRARPGLGPVEHWIEIENLAGHRVTVTQQDSLSMRGLKPEGQAEIWWINRGGNNASTQGGAFHQPCNESLNLTLYSNSDDGASPVPWLAVQIGNERGLYLGWEFSGLGRIHARAAARRGQLDIDVGNPPGFRTDVEPGEVFLVPAAFVGCYSGGLDDGSYSLHRFVLEKLRPRLPESCPDPILAYNLYLDAGGSNAKQSDVLRCAKICRELGFEVFMPDAMWFPEAGDWRWDPRRFPQGITPIEKECHAAGVRLALWCAWNNGGVSAAPGALSVRGPVGHPEWFNADFSPDWRPGPFLGGQICLGCPEAKQWAIEKTQWLVEHHKLDYLKHDCYAITTQCNKTTHRHHYGIDASYWATMGYYEVQEKLRKKFPKIILENCSGGGMIKDFGIVQRTHYTVTTDTLSNLPDRQSIYDSTFALPPLVLQAYTYDNVYPVKGDSPGTFLWRSGMMSAWQIDPSDTPLWNREDHDMVKRSVQIYKQWIRPILHDCKVHHILPRPDGIHWDGMFYWSETLRKGTFYIFRPESNEEEKTVKLKGLNPGKRYWAWGEEGSISPGQRTGAELMENGLAVKLPQSFTSDLIYLQDAAIGKPDRLDPPEEFRLMPASTTFSDPFSIEVNLSWAPSAGARSYRVVVSELPDLSKPILQSMTIEPCLSARELPPEKTFYWKVEAMGWGGRRWNADQAGSFTTPKVKGLPGVTFVSDMPWVKATAGANNPVRRDKNYYGKPVSLAGKIRKKAVWTHAFPDATPADVVLDISGKNFATFAAEAGLDNASGGGSVQFQVLVDGQPKAESPVLRPGQVHTFRVEVTNAQKVTLRVLNGGDGYASDHAAWGYARFIDVGAPDPIRDMK